MRKIYQHSFPSSSCCCHSRVATDTVSSAEVGLDRAVDLGNLDSLVLEDRSCFLVLVVGGRKRQLGSTLSGRAAMDSREVRELCNDRTCQDEEVLRQFCSLDARTPV